MIVVIRFLVCLLALASLGACAKAPGPLGPEGSGVDAVLAFSGGNRGELEAFLDSYPMNADMAASARFLVENLPVADRVDLDAETLREMVDYAWLARRSTDWGPQVPREVFRSFVLPHRVAQEPATRHRKYLYELLTPLVQGRSMGQAALAVNAWVASCAGFKPTVRWDQGVFQTLRRGLGRCEELVILLVGTLRSVGIPARQAIAPLWPHMNGNHAWAEVWVDGRWRYLDAGNPESELDRTWFSPHAARCPLVLAPVYGGGDGLGFPVVGTRAGSAILNTTGLYGETSELDFTVLDPDGKPVPGAVVYVSIYNLGSIRPMAVVQCDDQGCGGIDLGPGTVMLSCKQGDDFGYALARGGEEAVVELVPQGTLSGRFDFLRRDVSTAPFTLDEKASEQKQRMDRDREARMAAWGRAVARYLDVPPDDKNLLSQPFPKALAEARANAGEILRAVELAGDERQTLARHVSGFAAKDLSAVRGRDLVQDVALARKARERVGRDAYGDDVFFSHVLADRIFEEPYSHWRGDLSEMETDIKKINQRTASLSTAKRSYLGPPLTPLQALESGLAVAGEDRGVLAGAMLRSQGIPARYVRSMDWIEYFDHGEWRPMYPDDPGALGDENATDRSRAWYGEPGTLILRFERRGKALGQGVKPMRDFGLNVLTAKGAMRYVENLSGLRYDMAAHAWIVAAPAGDYVLVAASRNDRGESLVRAEPVRLKPGERIEITMELP